jgi:hypothetical protein
MRAAPEGRLLSDDEWAQVARDVMHRTGLSPEGQEDDAVRWIAVRHGDDHIHIVTMLARQDGRRPRLSNDRYRVREACRAAEERYGLRRPAPGDRTAAPPPSRAESEKATRNGRTEPPRVTLRRAVSHAAAAAGSEEEFFTLLRDSACWPAPATAPGTPALPPATPSPSTETSRSRGAPSGSAAGSSPPASPCPSCASDGPQRPRHRPAPR